MNKEYIAATMRHLRDAIRSGTVRVQSDDTFASQVFDYLGGTVPVRVAPRLDNLLAVPASRITQDDYAWALQNFINRRKDPWAWKRLPTPEDDVLKEAPWNDDDQTEYQDV